MGDLEGKGSLQTWNWECLNLVLCRVLASLTVAQRKQAWSSLTVVQCRKIHRAAATAMMSKDQSTSVLAKSTVPVLMTADFRFLLRSNFENLSEAQMMKLHPDIIKDEVVRLGIGVLERTAKKTDQVAAIISFIQNMSQSCMWQ